MGFTCPVGLLGTTVFVHVPEDKRELIRLCGGGGGLENPFLEPLPVTHPQHIRPEALNTFP